MSSSLETPTRKVAVSELMGSHMHREEQYNSEYGGLQNPCTNKDFITTTFHGLISTNVLSERHHIVWIMFFRVLSPQKKRKKAASDRIMARQSL